MAGPFCTIGDLTLQLAEAPATWREKGAFEFAEHPVLEGRPKLQAIGAKLAELQLEFQYHAGQVDIGFITNRLAEMRDGAEVVAVTMGDGEYLGEFVITECTFDRGATFDNGTSLTASLSVTLREYVAAAALVVTDRPAVKKGNPTRKTEGGVIKRDPVTGLFPQLADLISKLGKAMEQAK